MQHISQYCFNRLYKSMKNKIKNKIYNKNIILFHSCIYSVFNRKVVLTQLTLAVIYGYKTGDTRARNLRKFSSKFP